MTFIGQMNSATILEANKLSALEIIMRTATHVTCMHVVDS